MDRAKFLSLIEPAIKLVDRKGEDYNSGVTLGDYFPFNDYSYQQMLTLKVLRMRSVLGKETAPNFESLIDSAYDLINYTVFYLEYLTKEQASPEARVSSLVEFWSGHEKL